MSRTTADETGEPFVASTTRPRIRPGESGCWARAGNTHTTPAIASNAAMAVRSFMGPARGRDRERGDPRTQVTRLGRELQRRSLAFASLNAALDHRAFSDADARRGEI